MLAPATPIATVEPNQEALTAFRSSDTTAAADAIVQASGSGGDSAAAAGASMAQAMQAGDTQAVADATAAAAAKDPAATANVMAAAQTQAVARGATDEYARSTAQAFSAAANQGTTQQLTEAFAQVGLKPLPAEIPLLGSVLLITATLQTACLCIQPQTVHAFRHECKATTSSCVGDVAVFTVLPCPPLLRHPAGHCPVSCHQPPGCQ